MLPGLVRWPRMLIDGAGVRPGQNFTHDVCIVGSGPAGISIALALRGSGCSVALVESGGLIPSARAQDLYRGRNVGHDYFRLDACRYRMFGGNTNRWGGWSRPLDPTDFQPRDWMPDSGWPISAEDLIPYHARTAELLQMSTPRFDADYWQGRLPAPMELGSDSTFRSELFQYSPQTNFGRRYRSELEAADGLDIFLDSTVTDLRLAVGSDRLERVHARSVKGPEFTITPRVVVLGAGAIENARLLLTARTDRPAGLGNSHDLVGRYFNEHLHAPVGHLLLDPTVELDYYRRATRNGAETRGILTPRAGAQEREGLASASLTIEPERFAFTTPFVDWSPRAVMPVARRLVSLRTTRVAPVANAAQYAFEQAYNTPLRTRTGRASRRARQRLDQLGIDAAGRELHSLYIRSEQYLDRDSRVRLDPTARDEFGTPRIVLDWRVKPADTELVERWIGALDRDIRRAGYGLVLPPEDDWADGILGGPHHLSTTRMAASPRAGVVDADCRVHDVPNLFVAGSSVFSTGGHANPTFTLIALALRLADRLRRELSA